MSRQFAVMINAGLSLLRALTILEEQSENKTLAEVLGKVRTERRVQPPAKGRRETGIRDIVVRTRARDGRLVARRIIEVSWNPTPDKTMRATFSVERLGLREAMRRARATRREKEIEIYGAPLRAGSRRHTQSVKP